MELLVQKCTGFHWSPVSCDFGRPMVPLLLKPANFAKGCSVEVRKRCKFRSKLRMDTPPNKQRRSSERRQRRCNRASLSCRSGFLGDKNQAKDCRVVCGLSAWTCTDCVWPREKPVSGSLPRTLNMHFSGNDLEDFQVKQPLKTIVVSWSRLILDLVVAINMFRP